MKKLYSISTGIILFLGVGHTLLTPMFYPSFSVDALWFAGTGLALLFLGMLNWIAIRANLSWIYNFAIPANVIGGVFVTAVAVSVPEFQAILAAIAVWTTALTSITHGLNTNQALFNQ
jgi:hypothetical protein